MALIVENGIGDPTAESYDSLAGILAYITARKTAAQLAVWTALSTAVQEAHARNATQWIDATRAGLWKGYRASETQALAWPRIDVQDDDGYTIESTSIPSSLKAALAEATYRLGAGETLISDEAAGSNVAQQSVSVGSLSRSTTYLGGKSGQKSFPLIDGLLSPLVEGGSGGFGQRTLERA